MTPPRTGRPPLTPLEAAVDKALGRFADRKTTSADVAAALADEGFDGPGVEAVRAYLQRRLGRDDVRLDLITYEVVVGGVYAGELPDAVTLLVSMSHSGLSPKPLADGLNYGRPT